VGTTMLLPNETFGAPERVMDVDLTSHPKVPEYRKAHIERYFREHKRPCPSYAEFDPDFNTVQGLYNRIGRGYTDVSANGASTPLYLHGRLTHVFGASLSSPTFASIRTLRRWRKLAILD
jgi:tripeptidyl-peptidase I